MEQNYVIVSPCIQCTRRQLQYTVIRDKSCSIQSGECTSSARQYLSARYSDNMWVPVGVINVRSTLLYCMADGHREAWPAQWIVRRRRILCGTHALRRHRSSLWESGQLHAMPRILQHQAANVEPPAAQSLHQLLCVTTQSEVDVWRRACGNTENSSSLSPIQTC